MERTTCTLIYYLRKTRIDKEGKAPIYVRLTVNGQRAEVCARARILPRYWNQSRGKAVENNREGREINRLLEAISFNIAQTRRTLEAEGKEITATGIMDRYLGKDLPERHTLMEVFREHNKRCRALIGIDFTASTVQRYESLMRIIRIAQSNGWVPKDPFHGKHIHMEPVDRPFLEKQEFLSMLHKEISIPRLTQVRDIFCFCCLTGLAFMDVQQLKPEHLVADIHGKIWIRKARQKTKNMCNIPLLDEAQKIIDRYRDHPYCQTHGVLLPVCSNQKMNSYLKELADICGIPKNLSTHCARHTFATLTLASGATIDNVAKMLGHANVNMTRRYAKVLDSSIMRDMEVVAENMAL